jgi:hypothetical protein
MRTPSVPLAARRRPAVRLLVALAVLAAVSGGAPLGAQAGYDPDVLPRGRWALGLDTQAHRGSPAEASWLWALPGGALGLGRGLEAGLRVSLFEPRTGEGTHDLIPQLRWRAWADSSRGLRAGLGVIGVVPIGGVAGRRTAAYLTATGAWTVAATGTSLTLGAWQGMQPTALGEARRGAIVEAAQALTRDGRTQLSASWFSGRTLFGYLTVGVARDIGAHSLFVGWAHGNDPRFNTGPTVSWSWAP